MKKVFIEIERLINENKEYLGKLDGALGDGDIGVTTNKGFSNINKELKSKNIQDFKDFFSLCGFTLSEKAPSTIGTLLGFSFLKASMNFNGVTNITEEEMFVLFSSMSEEIKKKGNAKEGDKTILDSLIPAVKSLEKDLNKNLNLNVIIKNAFYASEKGMLNTINMMSNKGRSARYLEDSIGKQDPGATVSKIIFEGLHNYISN